MTGEREERQDLATEMAALARNLLTQDGVQATLDRIVASATELVDGCTDASLMVVRRHRVELLAATSDMARDSDVLQGELEEGPCWEAARTSTQMLRIADLTHTADRWPRFVAQARELGIGSMMAFLVFTGEQELGALNLYSRSPGALTDRSEQVGWLLASHAAVALAGARSTEGLVTALASRQTVGQAAGILMERRKITAEEAFDVLSRHSQDHNIKLRDVAEHLVATGELPAAPGTARHP